MLVLIQGGGQPSLNLALLYFFGGMKPYFGLNTLDLVQEGENRYFGPIDPSVGLATLVLVLRGGDRSNRDSPCLILALVYWP